ncbi:hypothetical protein H312_02122 [Anncaliia algerae PRA339]|uniref:Uncharacterized protein n=1 Tax=Anncaliia algerae PRA339 TaxID=1288291 RepID=A0A059F0G7_9MICR|nr:hypothetical protein H312_02122 [Anncaliia algerae PRA339]
MHKKIKPSKLETAEELAEYRRLGLIFKTKNILLETKHKLQLCEDNELEFCKKMKILNSDYIKYREKYFKKGVRGLKSILVRHGFRKERSDLVVTYLVNKYKL